MCQRIACRGVNCHGGTGSCGGRCSHRRLSLLLVFAPVQGHVAQEQHREQHEPVDRAEWWKRHRGVRGNGKHHLVVPVTASGVVIGRGRPLAVYDWGLQVACSSQRTLGDQAGAIDAQRRSRKYPTLALRDIRLPCISTALCSWRPLSSLADYLWVHSISIRGRMELAGSGLVTSPACM